MSSLDYAPYSLFNVVLSGGPVPQVGVTITMDDEALNGTNRVVLDGVLSQRECDTILNLATVSSCWHFIQFNETTMMMMMMMK